MARWSPIERSLREQYGPFLAGVDEVGRGPLAGPVVACAVVMPAEVRVIPGVDDSKRLSPGRREELAATIRERALAIALGAASIREIDSVNIYNATVLAMQRAIRRVAYRLSQRNGETPGHFVVDGKSLRTLGVEHTAIVKGDALCYSVACASIVAKVTRDRLMRSLSLRHDGYGWGRNSGYGTREHMQAIERLGLTPHHRRTFCSSIQTSLFEDD